MKKILLILLVIALLVGIAWKTKSPTSELVGEGTRCFLAITEGEDLTDTHYIELTFEGGDLVTGVDNWIPEAKDSNTGDFSGYIKDQDITVLFNGSGEGQTWKEERNYRLNNEGLLVGYSSEGTYEDEMGVFRPNPDSAITYSESLPEVSCGSVDKTKVFLN